MKGFAALVLALVAIGSPATAGGAGAALPGVGGCAQGDASLTRSDGSVLVAATVPNDCTPVPADQGSGIALVQLKADGSLDESVGAGGVVNLDQTYGLRPESLRPAAGDRFLLTTPTGLYRFNRDGTPDPTFGTSGRFVLTGPFDGFRVGTPLIQPDGKILLPASSLNDEAVLARITSDGQLDPGFGNAGIVDPLGPADSSASRLFGLGFAGQGRIAVGVVTANGPGVVRLLPDGNFDATYGPDGTGLSATWPSAPKLASYVYFAVAPDGAVRFSTAESALKWGVIHRGYALDADGAQLPDPGPGPGTPSMPLPGGGLAYSPESMTGDDPVFDLKIDPNWPSPSGALLTKVFPLAPGGATVQSIGSDPAGKTVTMVGTARGIECRTACVDASWIAVAKVDVSTGRGDSGFGTGGAVIVGGNECHHGVFTAIEPVTTPWNRCKVKRPNLTGSFRIGDKRTPRPSVTGRVLLGGPQISPPLGAKVKLSLPRGMQFSKNAPRRIKVTVTGSKRMRAVKLVGPRTAIFRTARFGYTENVLRDVKQLPNKPIKVRLEFRRGALEPIPQRLRGKKLKFRVNGTFLAPISTVQTDSGTRSIRWFHDNSRSTVLPSR